MKIVKRTLASDGRCIVPIVYVTENPYLADETVFVTDKRGEAHEIIFITDNPYLAKKKVFFTDKSILAKKIVYITDKRNEAQ